MDLRSNDFRKCINVLANNIRAENLAYESFIDLYAGEDNIANVNNVNNTVVYGRRGSGKTHLLHALREKITGEFSEKRNFPVYVDLRRIIPLVSAADGSMQAEAILIFKYLMQHISLSLAENVHFLFGLNEFDSSDQLAISARTTELADAFKRIYLEFDGRRFSKPTTLQVSEEEIRSLGATLSLSSSPSIGGKAERQIKTAGSSQQDSYISILDITSQLEELIRTLSLSRITVLLDEWSEIGLSTQLHLAEIIKKSFSAIQVSVKIAAIPNRTNLGIRTDEKYVGLEDGGDIQGYQLDMRYVAEVNKAQTRNFFNDLLVRHLSAIDKDAVDTLIKDNKSTYDKLVNLIFANVALNEILVACAGIPRDFISLLIDSYDKFVTAPSSGAKRISVANLRSAHVSWYESDKKEQVDKHPIERQLLQEIVVDVIEKKRSVHFLIPAKHAQNKHIQNLIDFRVMHLRKNGYSHKDHAGASYNVYSIDYGCYNSLNIAKTALDTSTMSELFSRSLRDMRRISLEDEFFQRFLMNIGEAFSCPHCKRPIDTNHLAFKKQSMCNHCYEKVDRPQALATA